MMLILRDDPVLEIFESPSSPPDWIETIDIENDEYSFCDDHGQRYVGVIVKPAKRFSLWFRPDRFELRPEGIPDIANALALVDRAVEIEPNRFFSDLASLRLHLLGVSDRQP
jgi:hypothetical protein